MLVSCPVHSAYWDARRDDSTEVGRVLWTGQHRVFKSDLSGRPLGSPLSKMPAAAVRLLVQQHGWKVIDEADGSVLPNFIFCTRKAGVPQYPPAHGPVVRQLPLEVSALLDDKIQMVTTLKQAAMDHLTPPHDTASSDSWATDTERVGRFVKHRGGVKGKSVHYFPDAAAARAWLDQKGGLAYYAVQHEVPGQLLNDNRRFVLRAHVLFTGQRGFLHRDVICLPYAEPYVAGGAHPKATVVSQAGKGHPTPYLWADQFDQCVEIAAGLVTALAPMIPQRHNVCWCHLMGLDIVLDTDGRLWLLEVNSYPAMGNGTMSAVPSEIYTRLSQDIISAVVLPALSGGSCLAQLGGFVKV